MPAPEVVLVGLRAEPDRLREVLDRGRVLAEAAAGVRAVEVVDGAAGKAFDCLRVHKEGLLMLTEMVAREPVQAVVLRLVRVEADGLGKRFDRILEFSELVQR